MYCTDCIYLIAVKTFKQASQYQIEVRSIDAEKQYTHLLRIGESKVVKLKQQNQT